MIKNDFSKSKKAIISLSGGLDSTTLLYKAVHELGVDNVEALSFDYNQRHDIELQQAKKTTALLGVKHTILDITFMGEIAKQCSAMVKGDVVTPDMEDILGDPQPDTYMPNRNMILISICAGFAESVYADTIALGLQSQDSYSYWDTTPDFYESILNVLKLNRKNHIQFVAPFVGMSKADELIVAEKLNVDYTKTWTCYNPVIQNNTYSICGKCPSCFERREAFKKAGISDPLEKMIING